MPHPYIPSREQAEASLDRFYQRLGHRPLSLRFDAMPRLSGRAVHTDLAATVQRLRQVDAVATAVRPAQPIRSRIRRARRSLTRDANRAFDQATTATTAAIACWVGVPVALALIAGTL